MFQIRRKISLESLSLGLILLTHCAMWFYEDILNLHPVAILLSVAAYVILLVKGRARLVPGAWVFLLYLLGIYISFLASGGTFRTIYRYILTILILVYMNIANGSTDDLNFVNRGIILMGVFGAVCVMVQFVLKDAITDPFYSILSENTKTEALFYYSRGYYSGIITKPHEAAGLISLAMASLLIDKWTKGKLGAAILPLVLAVPLLLTGKRAIFAFAFLTLFLLYAFTEFANRRYKKIVGIGVLGLVLVVLAVGYIGTHADNPMFARFAKLINSEGGLIDDTRLRLWSDALELWSENILFGVGWQNFPDYSISRFAYSRSHAVNLDYLQFLCETGLVGFVLIMTPIVFMFVRAFRLSRFAATQELPQEQKRLIFLAAFIQIFVLMYALVEVPFYSTMYFALYIFSCIIINAYYSQIPQLKQKKIIIKMK